MSLEENKSVVRRFIHEGVIGGNLAIIDELCSPDCINHSAVPEARHGTEGVKRVVGFSRAAMPDQRWTNEMLIAEGDLGKAGPWRSSSCTSSASGTARLSSTGQCVTTSR